MKVLVLHTLPPEIVPPGRVADEFELHEAAEEIARAFPGAVSAGVRGRADEIISLLSARQPDVIFNLCEAPLGRPDLEAHVAALFEWLGVPFTGCGSETLALCRRKDRTDAALAACGVPVPRAAGGFPCIVKPADEDGSAGIDDASVCENEEELKRARARLSGPVVVQEFLPGREFSVSLWGCAEPDSISIGETRFEGGLRLNTYTAKWDEQSAAYDNSPLFYQAELEPSLQKAVWAAARGAWRAVEARGYLRLDIRLDAEGEPRVLDVNPNPAIWPWTGIHRAVMEAGWTWERFVRLQVEAAYAGKR